MTFEMTLREREEDVREEGMEAVILTNLEDGKTQEQIETRLMQHFNLDAKMAREIFNKYAYTSASVGRKKT